MGKSLGIAACAGITPLLYLFALPTFYPTWEMNDQALGGLLFYTSLGSFLIGLPIALLTFWLSREHLIGSPQTLAMIAVLAGIMMMLASFVIGDENGVIVLGVPAFIAAITFGALGWFWILVPLRSQGVE